MTLILSQGTRPRKFLPIAFVYSGNGLANGLAWAGWLSANCQARFSAHFEVLDNISSRHAGWSLRDMLFSEELARNLSLTSVAQPLLFAIQSAATVELRSRGITPVAIIGHSVGEIAARRSCRNHRS